MKNIITFVLYLIIFQASAQISVETTRTTHLLVKQNQAMFTDSLILQAGEQIILKKFSDKGYFRIGYGNEEFFIYYPYFNDVEEIESIKSRLLSREQQVAPTAQPVSGYTAKPQTVKRSRSSSSQYIQTGPRGGRYYINSKGKKTYVKH